jgi:hypothetical protein
MLHKSAHGTNWRSMPREYSVAGEALYAVGHIFGGTWKIGTVYYTDCAEQVELISHEFIDQLDKSAPFGEVFSCSMLEARAAVE